MGGAEGEDRNLSILLAENVLSTKAQATKGGRLDMFDYMNCSKLICDIKW